MGDSPFIKFYPSDFLGGTSGLSPAERGVYMTLLCAIYEEDGPIVRDEIRLARQCGAPKAAFRRILSELISAGKLTDTDGMLSNDRAEKMIVDRRNRTQNATHAANLKWSAQREKSVKNQGQSNAGAVPTQCVENAKPEPEPEPEVKREAKASPKKRRRKPEVELPEGWVPSDKNIEDAQSKGLSKEEIDHEADKFRNHHHSKQSLFRDWDAAWRTWVANAIKFRRKGSSADSSSRQISFAARAGRSPREDCF